jgi:hypothetical protein
MCLTMVDLHLHITHTYVYIYISIYLSGWISTNLSHKPPSNHQHRPLDDPPYTDQSDDLRWRCSEVLTIYPDTLW